MESIEQIEQLIAQTERETAQLDEKIAQEAAGAGVVETDIEHLKEEVAKVEVAEVKGDGEQLGKDILSVQEALAGLTEQIGQAKAVEERRKQQGAAELEQLNAHKAQLQAQLAVENTTDTSRETQASELLSAAQKQLAQENEKIQALLADFQRENLQLSALQAEIDALHSQEKSTHQAEQNALKWQAEEAKLLEELNKLEQQTVEIDSSIKESAAAYEVERQTAVKEVTQNKAELSTEKQLNKRLTAGKHTTEGQIKQLEQETALEQAKIEEFQKVIVALEVEAKRLEQQVGNLKKGNKAIRESIKEEEQRQKEEEAKSKVPKKSTKDLITKQEKEHEKLSRELQREKARLESQIKLKSTYISADNLNILQREYQRHRQPNGPSLETKTAQKDRLVRDNKALVDSIANLKRIIKEVEAKESKVLAESKKKGDTLTAERLAIEKQYNNNNSKLNEYLKQFPNHTTLREEKTKRAKQEKALAEQEKIISSTVDDPPQAPVKSLRKSGKFKSKLNRDTDNNEINNLISQYNDSSPTSEQNFKQTSWFKRRSLKDFELQPETPFYKNLYFQAAVGLFGLLVVVMIS